MTPTKQKIRKSAINLWLGMVLSPVILLVPFSTLTGFFSIDKLLLVLFCPYTYICLFALVIFLICIFEFWFRTSFAEEKTVRRFFNKTLGLVFFAVLGMECIAWVIIRPIANVIFPFKEVYTFFVVISFECMLSIPFISALISSQERYLRENFPDSEQWFSLSQKIWIYVGVIFLGTIMLLGLSNTVATLAPSVGRKPLVSILQLNLIACGFALLMMFSLITQLSKYILRPIKRLLLGFSLGLTGDLRVRASTGTTMDEIGDVSHKADLFFSSIREQFLSLRSILDFLVDLKKSLGSQVINTVTSIEQITSSVNETLASVQSQAANVEETAATVEELTRSIDSLGSVITLHGEKLSKSNNTVNTLALANKDIHLLIEKTLSQSKSLAETTSICKPLIGKMLLEINSLSQKSENLSSANLMIKNISGRTNILAMNAAIEAAHAREFGKGFSVVADEIRKLAGQSTNQSQVVSEDLKESIESTNILVEDSQAVSSGFEVVDSNVTATLGFCENLKSFSAENIKNAEIIQDSLKEIGELSSNIHNGSDEMRAGNSEILSAVSNLRKVSENISHAMSEIDKGLSGINESGKELSESNKKTDDVITQLKELLNKFILD